jgi:hypothetical protein
MKEAQACDNALNAMSRSVTQDTACYTCMCKDGYACARICLCKDMPVQGYACARICLCKDMPVQGYACARICLYKDMPVQGYACARICLHHACTMPASACTMPAPCLHPACTTCCNCESLFHSLSLLINDLFLLLF